MLDPWDRASAFGEQLAILADGSRTNDEIGTARATIVAQQPLDEVTFNAITGRRIAVDPWEISIAFGYRTGWNPLPVIQSYTAYTASLDQRNADRLADAEKGPERILRHSLTAIDGHNPVWESPAAIRAMLCHYRQITDATGDWQVLERTANRCGAPREISRVETRLGQPVKVPPAPAGQLLYVDIDGFGPGPLEKLRKLVYRAVTRTVVLDGTRSIVISPETVGDGLLLRVPSTADYSPALFALDLKPQTIALRRGSGTQAADTVRLRFIAVPIRG
jgi:hypothetical protein